MTDLLVRLFVKDHENTSSAKVRTAYGVMSGMVGICCNLLLFGVKITIGLLIGSISVTADAFNNLSDAGSSIISLIGVKLAKRPADQEHPFGHGRYEYISAFIIAIVILLVGFSLAQESFQKILHPQMLGFSWVMVGILSVSVFLKLWMSLFNKNLAKRINSNIMKATSADSLNDVVVTTVTICSIVIGKLANVAIDGWTGLAVSLFVMYSGFNIAKVALMPLLGEAADKQVHDRITEKVESYPGIVGSHDLIAHNYGPSHTMATIHVEVANNSNLEQIHEVIDQIERDVLREMGIFLVIHMDPVEMNDQKVLHQKNMVVSIVRELEPKADVHDFRVVNGEHSVNLIFDLVVPYAYHESQECELLEKITDRVMTEDPRCHCVVTVEKNYVAGL